jgi:hypothetical protein
MVLATASCSENGGRLTELGRLLRQDSVTSTESRGDRHFNGGPSLSVEATFSGTVEDASAAIADRLSAAGYRLTCPGERGDPVPPGQEGTTEPRRTCRVQGHGTDGTLWFATAPGDGVKLSAVVVA